MKVNHKAMYLMLKQQAKVLQNQISPAANVEQVNELPENFNQTGWDSTIEKVEQMLEKMKQLRTVKGNRLTPQFYRSIYNRALIACGEADKTFETLTAATATDIDYAAECVKLNAEIYTLNIEAAKLAEIAKANEEAAAAATAAAAKVAEAALKSK